MKCFFAIITTAFMFFSYATAGPDDYSVARNLADFMQEHYDVTILIGDECKQVETIGFQLGDTPTGSSPLKTMLGQYCFENRIKSIDDYIAAYPPGFFEKFRCEEAENGLRILLSLHIIEDGSTMAGKATIQDGFYNIFLGLDDFDILTFHHEIWHAMEYRITAENSHIFDDWAVLNPEGFKYNGDYFARDEW